MRRTSFLITYLFIFCILNKVTAQNKYDAILKQLSEADKKWNEGDFSGAEKIYWKVITVTDSAVNRLGDLSRKKLELGDMKGYNDILELARIKQRKYIISGILPKHTYAMELFDQMDQNIMRGDPKYALKYGIEMMENLEGKYEKKWKGYFFYACYQLSEAAFLLEDRTALERLTQLGKTFTGDDYANLIFPFYLNLLNKQYDAAIQSMLQVEQNGADFTSSKPTARWLLSIAYSYKGDNEKALEYADKAKRNIFIGDGVFKEVYGRVAFNQQKYAEAIKYFTEAMKGRKSGIRLIEPTNKYKLYYQRGMAYQGSGDLIKAKRDFESALAYSTTYEPAANAIASLEGKMITNRITDKTPPKISILEPGVTRGLKVTTSAKDLMIKGIADDPSGLKTVYINGTQVYNNEKGDFWGTVPLNEGINKLTVIATDLANNSVEEIFEIERNKPVTTGSKDDIIPVKQKQGRNFALLIGSQNYTDPNIPSLENPIADAVKLKLALKNNYSFIDENIFTLFNPDKQEFRKKFVQIAESLEPDDNLIIFYAGHGIWVEKEKKGYWLLTDAQRNDINSWLPNKEVLDMIASVPSRHTLLITDACFSGSVFKTRGLGAEAPPAMREMSEKISRVAITSGNDSEVPDESVFMKYLIKALSETKEKYFTAQKMFITQILEAVMTETKTEPRYGTLELAGHVGGDFIFVKK